MSSPESEKSPSKDPGVIQEGDVVGVVPNHSPSQWDQPRD